MSPANEILDSSSEREIVITRVFDAPRELVFQAFIDPNHVTQWWGPKGFTTTTHQMDVRPGGVWRYVMHGPDGRDYDNKISYLEVVRPERLRYKLGGDVDGQSVSFEVYATFDALPAAGGKPQTKLTWRMVFPSASVKNFVIKEHGALEGARQTIGRLSEHLAVMDANEKPFIISRTFDAPRAKVWKAWTEVEQMKQWFGPKGLKTKSAKMDLRPGGIYHFCLESPDGAEMWGKFAYREVVPQERIVWVHSFSDAKGGITRHPMSPDWPAEMLATVTFTEHEGKTTVTVRWSAMNATAAERKVFDENYGGMTQGWTGTFEQLEEYLAKG